MLPLSDHGFQQYINKENQIGDTQTSHLKEDKVEKGRIGRKVLSEASQPTADKLVPGRGRLRAASEPGKSLTVPLKGIKEDFTIKVPVKEKGNNSLQIHSLKERKLLVEDYAAAIRGLKGTPAGTYRVWLDEGSLAILQNLSPREVSPGDAIVMLEKEDFKEQLPVRLVQDQEVFLKEKHYLFDAKDQAISRMDRHPKQKFVVWKNEFGNTYEMMKRGSTRSEILEPHELISVFRLIK